MCHFQAVQHTSSTHIDYLLKPPWYSIPETWEVEVSAVSDYSIHHSAGWLESVLPHLEGIPVGCPHLLKGCRATTSQMRSAALEGELFCFGAIMYGKANDCSSKMLFSKHSPWDGGLWNLDFLGGGRFFYESQPQPWIKTSKILNINLLFHEWNSVEGAIYSWWRRRNGSRHTPGGKDLYQQRENHALFELLMKTILPRCWAIMLYE